MYLRRRSRAGVNLHQGHDVGGIEVMDADHSLRGAHIFYHGGYGHAAGVTGDDIVFPGGFQFG